MVAHFSLEQRILYEERALFFFVRIVKSFVVIMDGNFERIINIIFIKLLLVSMISNKLDFDKNILLNRKERKKSFHKIFVENIYKNYTIREFYQEKNDKCKTVISLLLLARAILSINFRGNEANWIVRETWNIARQDRAHIYIFREIPESQILRSP